jgi:hypothetical protein
MSGWDFWRSALCVEGGEKEKARKKGKGRGKKKGKEGQVDLLGEPSELFIFWGLT